MDPTLEQRPRRALSSETALAHAAQGDRGRARGAEPGRLEAQDALEAAGGEQRLAALRAREERDADPARAAEQQRLVEQRLAHPPPARVGIDRQAAQLGVRDAVA